MASQVKWEDREKYKKNSFQSVVTSLFFLEKNIHFFEILICLQSRSIEWFLYDGEHWSLMG